MKCKNCNFAKIEKRNGNPSRYYCEHENAPPGADSCICRCKRHDDEITIKTAPKWCPINAEG